MPALHLGRSLFDFVTSLPGYGNATRFFDSSAPCGGFSFRGERFRSLCLAIQELWSFEV